MNFGAVVLYGLNRSGIPFDAASLEFAKVEANLIIQDLWYLTPADYKTSSDSVVTVAGYDEYTLNKFFERFVKNTFQGPSSRPIFLQYRTPEEFFRTIQLQIGTSGSPSLFTLGEMIGYDAQLSSADTLTVVSTRANDTTGTINVVAGDDRIKGNTATFNRNQVGLRIKVGSDSKTYKIGKYISATEIQLTEKYRGVSATGTTYAIGDIGVRVCVSGFVSGQLRSVEAELNGTTSVPISTTFYPISNISKTDRTGGSVVVQNSGGTQTVGTMAPGEMEIERQTIILWPKPSAAETLPYRFYMHHPFLWLDSDRILVPKKWHRLIAYKLTRRLLGENNESIPADLEADIEKLERQFENEANDTSLMDGIPDADGRRLGDQYYIDKIDSEL